MVALLLSAAILLYLMLLGVGAAALFARRIPLAIFLSTPSIGLGILIPIEITFNRAGLPVAVFGAWLVLALGLASATCVAIRRPMIPWGQFAPMIPWLTAGGFLAGAPMLLYGFHWAGNSNGDMGVYTANASNLLHYGFFSVPPIDQLVSGSDPSRSWWFFVVLPPNRFGTDALLALVAATTRIETYFAYMPCAVAGFAALIMAVGALCANAAMRNRLWIATALIAVACPLMLFTVYQQILPMLLGEVAIATIVALVQLGGGRRTVVQRAVTLGCAASALTYIYPEISPLLVAGAIITIPFAILRNRDRLRPYLIRSGIVAGVVTATILVLQNVQIFTFIAQIRILLAIVADVSAETGPGIINYYLAPSGLANLWGFLPYDYSPEPWLSLAIIAGGIIFALSLLGGIWYLRKTAKVSDGMLVVLLLQLAYLIAKQSSYSAYKTAYVILPFWMPLAALSLLKLGDITAWNRAVRPFTRGAVLAVAVALTGYSTAIYLGSTADLFAATSARFTELHAASKDDVYGLFAATARTYQAQMWRPFKVDVTNDQAERTLGIALRGHPMEFEDIDGTAHLVGRQDLNNVRALRVRTIAGWPKGVRAEAGLRAKEFDRFFFWRSIFVLNHSENVLVPPPTASDERYFKPDASYRHSTDGIFIESGRDISILNRTWNSGHYVLRAVPWHQVHHWLGFVDSSLGPPPGHHKPGMPDAIGPVEPDPFNPQGDLFAMLGNKMLLQVINEPKRSVRLVLEISATLNPRPNVEIPPITIAGASHVVISHIGSGSARIITPPVRPLEKFGRRYLELYFGPRLYKFPYRRTWLMSLYGRNVDIDPRYFALFSRNISIAPPLSDAPEEIAAFPGDLLNRSVYYSGIYEDGWVGRRFSVRLRSPGSSLLRLRINIPPQSIKQRIAVRIDGHRCTSIEVVPNTYVDVSLHCAPRGNHVITVEAPSVSYALPHDARPTWGRLQEIGFQPILLGARTSGKPRARDHNVAGIHRRFDRTL